MKLLSTKDSAKNGEPSLFAIAESLFAVGLSLWLGCTYGTWWHVFISSVIAPLMLLRTDASCRTGIGYYFASVRLLQRVSDRFTPLFLYLNKIPRLLLLPVVLALVFITPTLICIAMLIAVLASRVIATTEFLCRDFVGQVSAIPTNYWRITIATDICTSPELMPTPNTLLDEEVNYCNFEAYRFPALVQKGFLEPMRLRGRLVVILLKPLSYSLLALTIAICFAYRISVKASAIVWLPVLWALSPVKKGVHPWETQLRVYWGQRAPQIIGTLSLLSLLLLGFKYILWALRFKTVEQLESVPLVLSSLGGRFVPGVLEWATAVIRPGAIPSWHIAVAVNSILGLFFWWRVWTWLVEYDHRIGPPDAQVHRTIAITFAIRRLLTAYTIIWNLFIIYNIAKFIPVPEIGWKLFPWV